MARKGKKPKKSTTRPFSKKKMPKGAVMRVKVRKGAQTGRTPSARPAVSQPPKKGKYRPAYKSQAIPECTIEQALQDAFSEIESLRDEMQEIVDNMSGMEHLPKYETADTAQQELDSHTECPDVPEVLKNKTISTLTKMVSTRKGRGVGRSMRLGNATSIVKDVIEFLNELENAKDAGVDVMQAAKDLADELSEHENIEVEFPGMYG